MRKSKSVSLDNNASLFFSEQESVSSCVPCTPGSYCDGQGNSAVTAECDPGFYCTLGSWLAQPSSPEGGECQPGTSEK